MRLLVAAAAAAIALAASPAASAAGGGGPAELPLPAQIVERVTVRSAPDPRARKLTVLHAFRSDYRPQIVLVLAVRMDAHDRRWLKISYLTRPNGRRGWIPGSAAILRRVTTRIVIDRGARRIEVRRRGRVVLSGRVAVGRPGMETPLGRNFYVTARFVPRNSFLGVFALETSAYSRLSEWPGGGVVGIHGTSVPHLLGRAVSHGCVRVHNSVAARLRQLAPVGTPIDIVA